MRVKVKVHESADSTPTSMRVQAKVMATKESSGLVYPSVYPWLDKKQNESAPCESYPVDFNGRDGGIRTRYPLHPTQAAQGASDHGMATGSICLPRELVSAQTDASENFGGPLKGFEPSANDLRTACRELRIDCCRCRGDCGTAPWPWSAQLTAR